MWLHSSSKCNFVWSWLPGSGASLRMRRQRKHAGVSHGVQHAVPVAEKAPSYRLGTPVWAAGGLRRKQRGQRVREEMDMDPKTPVLPRVQGSGRLGEETSVCRLRGNQHAVRPASAQFHCIFNSLTEVAAIKPNFIFSVARQMGGNAHSCPNGDAAFSSSFLRGIMPEIYFFSKLKPLKPRHPNAPSPSLRNPARVRGRARGWPRRHAAARSVPGHYPVGSPRPRLALCC